MSKAATNPGVAPGSPFAQPVAAPGEAAPRKVALTPAEAVRERALAAGEEIAEYIRLSASGEAIPDIADRKAELASLRRDVQELSSRGDALAARNAELERQLSAMTAAGASARGPGESEAELRQRIETLNKHLDAADRHVASMRDRLDADSAEANRRIGQLESRLATRETELSGEVERLGAALAAETARLGKKAEDLLGANQTLIAQSEAAAAAARQQRQGLEGRIAALLADIEEAKARHAEAMADRDRALAELQRDLEKTRSAAGLEQLRLRQALSESEAVRQREATQHAATVNSLRANIAALERDVVSQRDQADAERRRLETEIVDERDRARRLIAARDEQRRQLEARAQAAEKQAAIASAATTRQVGRLQLVEQDLAEERSSREDEVAAMDERIEALERQLAAAEHSSQLVIDELRLRLHDSAPGAVASDLVSEARARIGTLTAELEAFRAAVPSEDDAVPQSEAEETAEILDLAPAAEMPAKPAAADLPAAAAPLWRRGFAMGNGRR